MMSLYAKAATLLFALFCVASGQIIKTASTGAAGDSTKTVKGIALFASDSTMLKNIKLYLCEASYPVYGMSGAQYRAIDSTITDQSGNFVIDTKIGSLRHTNYSVTTIAPFQDRVSNTSLKSKDFYYPETTDTIFTLYLAPYTQSSVKNQSNRISTDQIFTNQGKTITIKIPEWVSEKKSASVINIKGETIANLQASAEGNIYWNTVSVAKGIYLLNIRSSSNEVNVKIAVK
jgi:hypothetical protein